MREIFGEVASNDAYENRCAPKEQAKSGQVLSVCFPGGPPDERRYSMSKRFFKSVSLAGSLRSLFEASVRAI